MSQDVDIYNTHICLDLRLQFR